MLKTLSHALLSLIFPEECRACSGPVESIDDGVACSECWSRNRIFSGNETLCDKCGAFLFEGRAKSTTQCRDCLDLHFDRAFAIGLYEHALAASIIYMKQTPRVAKRLRVLLAQRIDLFGSTPVELLIPIPLSARRQRERGFNQAALIAEVLARHSKLPMDSASLVRRVHTPMHRAGMDRKARELTVRNAFEVTRPKLIEGRHILLVDDVMTSGETASTCAKALKQHGASTVNVLTVARAE